MTTPKKAKLTEKTVIAKPAFPWAGGKRLLAKHIVPFITPHQLFVDVFCGAGGLFFNKPQSKAELLNDINGDLVSFFRCAKFHLAELLREPELNLNSRADFYDFKKQPGLTDIQKAARW